MVFLFSGYTLNLLCWYCKYSTHSDLSQTHTAIAAAAAAAEAPDRERAKTHSGLGHLLRLAQSVCRPCYLTVRAVQGVAGPNCSDNRPPGRYSVARHASSGQYTGWWTNRLQLHYWPSEALQMDRKPKYVNVKNKLSDEKPFKWKISSFYKTF